MRPKKRILLVDGNEDAASVRRLVLHVHSYYVCVVPTTKAALAAVRGEPNFDVLVCRLETEGALDFVRVVQAELRRRKMPEIPVLLFSDAGRKQAPFAGGSTMWGKLGTEELLHALKVLDAKKRGPKAKPVERELPPEMWQKRA